MREYIFTKNEIEAIKQFHQDGRKTQAIRLLKHRCEEQKANLEEHIQILDDFLNDYKDPTPPCFGTDKVFKSDKEREVNPDCLQCGAQGKCITAYMEGQR